MLLNKNTQLLFCYCSDRQECCSVHQLLAITAPMLGTYHQRTRQSGSRGPGWRGPGTWHGWGRTCNTVTQPSIPGDSSVSYLMADTASRSVACRWWYWST